MDEKTTVRSVFGKEVDISHLDGVDIQTYLEASTRLLQVENGDPDFEYGWLDTRDPLTSMKTRKGFWELVDPETDPVIAPGATKDGSSYRVNELVLARMTKELFKKLRNAKDAIALRREAVVADQYRGAVQSIAGRIAADATGEPSVVKTESIREVVEKPARKAK